MVSIIKCTFISAIIRSLLNPPKWVMLWLLIGSVSIWKKTFLRPFDQTHTFIWWCWVLCLMKWDCTTTAREWCTRARCSMRTRYWRGRRPSTYMQWSRRQKWAPSGRHRTWDNLWCMRITENNEWKKISTFPLASQTTILPLYQQNWRKELIWPILVHDHDISTINVTFPNY